MVIDRSAARDGGFTLLETVVSVFVISVVMTAMTTFFVRAVSLTSYQGGLQVAAQLGATAISKVRGMNSARLTAGRDTTSSGQQWATASTDARYAKVKPHLAGMLMASDNTAAPGVGGTAPLSTTAQTVRVNGVDYEQNFYLGSCWQPKAGGACTATPAAGDIPFLRVVVGITWQATLCPASRCGHAVSTLVSSQVNEPLFDTSGPPKLTNPGDQTGPVDSLVDLQIVVTDGSAPLLWTYTGLPTGLTGNSAGRVTGPLSGSPGTFPVVVTVKDAANRTASVSFNWVVTPLPYPQMVLRDSPWAYHRLEEDPSTAATSVAADTSPNNRPGTYYGTTNGPSMRWNFDEGAGTAVADRSGAANPGAMGAGATWTAAGRSGSAMSFNGSANGWVDAKAPAVDTAKSFTVSAWVNVASVGATTVNTAVSQSGNVGTAFYLQEHFGRWKFQMTQQDVAISPGETTASLAPAAANNWTHLTGVFDKAAGTMKLYVDGVLQATTAHTVTWSATKPTQVGHARYNNVRVDFFNGRIDEVRTYRRALSAAEVATVATEPAELYWPFEEGSGTTTADLAGADDTGTLGTATTWAGVGNGRFGNAVTFNGNAANGYVQNSRALIRTDQSFTVAAWVYLTAANGYRTAVAQGGTNVSAFYLQRHNNGRWVLNMPEADTTVNHVQNFAYSIAPAALNTWVHLVAKFDAPAQQLSLWVDGALQQSAAHTTAHTWNATGPVNVGRGYYAGWSDAWAGSIDEVQLYQRALTAGEIRALAEVPNMTADLPGALQGTQAASTSTAFAGSSNGYTNAAMTNPNAFTVECWFKVSGTIGGVLIGFNDNPYGITTPTIDEPVLYLDSGGRLSYGLSPATSTVLRSGIAYNDAAWHHVAATLGTNGRRLYVDGQLVASGPAAGPQSYTGYWRWGGLQLGPSWPHRPTNAFLVGTLDEVAIYDKQLTDQQILGHYQGNV